MDVADGAFWLLDLRNPTLLISSISRLGGSVSQDDLAIFLTSTG